jgi:hypothetical protein
MQAKDKKDININIEGKDVSRRDPFYKEKSVHYVHKNKKKYNRKDKHKKSSV